MVFLYLNSNAQSNVNFPVDSLVGIPKIDQDSVVQADKKEYSELHKNDLPRADTKGLVSSRVITGSEEDIEEAFPYGVDLTLTDSQIQQRLDEVRDHRLYGRIFAGFILLVLIGAWRYYKKKLKLTQSIKADALIIEPRILSVDFSELHFENTEWNQYAEAIFNNSNKINNYFNDHPEELIEKGVVKCFDYISNTSTYVNLLCNKAGVHDEKVRHFLDLYCLNVIQLCLWTLEHYTEYTINSLKQFKFQWEYTDMQSKAKAVKGMLDSLNQYPMSADVKLRFDHTIQKLKIVKLRFDFKLGN